ncbi:major facilitator superfamily-like protein [Aureococcus anophagefferens]|nr:major facilitator superfamily-like protein [Aureococcus anophagefferens]
MHATLRPWARPGVRGLLLGASTVAALASTTGCGCVGRRFGFRAPLVAARFGRRGPAPLALAPSARSSGSARAAQGCALLGRLLLGLGSTEPVNRRYIGEAVPPSKRIAAAAKFVAAGATGMGCGPLLSGLLSFLLSRDDGARPRDHVFELKVDSTVAPALLLSVAWCLLAFYVASAFREPPARERRLRRRRRRSARAARAVAERAAHGRRRGGAAQRRRRRRPAACEVFRIDVGRVVARVRMEGPRHRRVPRRRLSADDAAEQDGGGRGGDLRRPEILFAATAATARALALATATGFAYVWAAAGGALFLGASTMESALMSLIGQWAARRWRARGALRRRRAPRRRRRRLRGVRRGPPGPARLALSLFGPVFGLLAATVALLALSLVQRRRNTKPVEPSDDARRREPGEDRRLTY